MKTTDAILYQDRLDRELEQRRKEVSAREYAALEQRTTTKHTKIPDMRDALRQVQTHGSEYPEDYKDYIRRTSGRII